MGSELGVMLTQPLMMYTTIPTGHQDDPPTANPTPQRRWGAESLDIGRVLNHIWHTPMPKLGPILTLNPFIWVSSRTLATSTD